jgi:hypothetical protein
MNFHQSKQQLAPSGKQPLQARKRGKHMTAAKWAAQFPDDMSRGL